MIDAREQDLTTEGVAAHRILLVDDDERFLRMMERIVAKNHLCSVATDGKRALQTLRETEFDLVVSDLLMPGINGADLLVHCHGLWPEMALLLVTGGHDPTVFVQFESLPCARAILQKPFSTEELSVTVDRLLRKRQTAPDRSR